MVTNRFSNKRIRIQAVIPEDWLPRLREVLEKRGYYSFSELVRDLIRREMGVQR